MLNKIIFVFIVALAVEYAYAADRDSEPMAISVWSLKIPPFSFTNASVSNCFKYLETASRAADPDGNGIQIERLPFRHTYSDGHISITYDTPVSVREALDDIVHKGMGLQYELYENRALVMWSTYKTGIVVLKGRCVNHATGEPISKFGISSEDHPVGMVITNGNVIISNDQSADLVISTNGEYMCVASRKWAIWSQDEGDGVFMKASFALKQRPLSIRVESEGFESKTITFDESEIQYFGINKLDISLQPLLKKTED